MNGLVMVVGVMAAAFAQSWTAPWTALQHAKAPFLAGVVVYYALNHGGMRLLAAAWLCGAVYAALAGSPPGAPVVALLLMGLCLMPLRPMVLADSALTYALLGAPAVFGATVLCGAFLLRQGAWAGSGSGLFLKALGEGLLAMPVVPVVCLFLRRLDLEVGNVPRRTSVEVMD